MEINENVLGRIEQSFILFKNNFKELFLPLFIYNLLSLVVFWTLLMYFFLSGIWDIIKPDLDLFSFLNNPYVIISIIVWTMAFIIYLMLYLPILLGLIKSIKQAYEWNKITSKENVIYWFSRLKKSFNTYWYIFSYVALIPSIVFILWGLLFNISYYVEWYEFLKNIWIGFLILGWIIFLLFFVYRWVKTKFSIYSAIDNDTFTKDDFSESLKITDNNWRRIVWNLFLIWLIISSITWFIWWIINIFSYWWIDFTSIRSINDISWLFANFSITGQLIGWFINNIISTIGAVFLIIFTYLFFIRLSFESKNKNVIWNENINKNWDINL